VNGFVKKLPALLTSTSIEWKRDGATLRLKDRTVDGGVQ